MEYFDIGWMMPKMLPPLGRAMTHRSDETSRSCEPVGVRTLITRIHSDIENTNRMTTRSTNNNNSIASARTDNITSNSITKPVTLRSATTIRININNNSVSIK